MRQVSTKELLANLEKEYIIPQDTFSSMYAELIKGFLTSYINMTATDKTNPSTFIAKEAVDTLVTTFSTQEAVITTSQTIAIKMTEATMQKTILTQVGELTSKLMSTMASSFNVDENKIASAFKINIDEDEIKRLIETMSSNYSYCNK